MDIEMIANKHKKRGNRTIKQLTCTFFVFLFLLSLIFTPISIGFQTLTPPNDGDKPSSPISPPQANLVDSPCTVQSNDNIPTPIVNQPLDPTCSDPEEAYAPPVPPPEAFIDIISPNPAAIGETIYFKGHGVSASSEITEYNWHSDADGNFSNKSQFNYSSLSNGIHTISFKVKDNQNQWSQNVTETLIINILPIANAGDKPYLAWINESITFNASESYDPDGTITNWTWDFGDGTIKTGEIVQHIYTNADVYTVRLTVTDNYDGKNSIETTATVVENSPIANANGPYSGNTNESITFNGSNSFDIDGTIISYLWDFGDGTTSTGVLTNHTYKHNGTYTVTLTVTDNDQKSDTDTTYAIITQTNNPPTKPNVTYSISNEDLTYVFTAESKDPDGDLIRYIFIWGDGTNTTTMFFPSGTKITATNTWADSGNYLITVYAEDDGNLISEKFIINLTINSNTNISQNDDDCTLTKCLTCNNNQNYTNLIILLVITSMILSYLVFLYRKRSG